MSRVVSFRLDSLHEEILKECQLPGTDTTSTLFKALEYYYDNVVMANRDCDVVLDFEDNYDGINNPKVEDVLNVLCENGFEIYMYLDGDKVGLNKIS